MAEKLRPCLGGIVRHSWQFLRNVELTSTTVRPSGTTVHVRVKGRYRCQHCAAIKYGQSQFVLSTPEPARAASGAKPEGAS
jgi:hypothetical protein